MQVLGHTGAANLVDFPGDPFQGMNMDDVFGSFRRPAGGDRRRTANYRSFPERPGAERGGAFHHPLLTRPSPTPGAGTTAGITSSSLWPSTSSIVRDAEAMLGGMTGGALDVTHFYMYDGPLLSEHADGLFGERGVGGPPPPLLDFSMDPVYLMGRRGGWTEGRLSSWTDDGQPQAGAQAAAVAQAIEEQFISQLRILVPGDESPSGQPPANLNTPAGVESTDARNSDAADNMVEGGEPQASTLVTESSMSEQQGAATGEPLNTEAGVSTEGGATGRVESVSGTVNQTPVDLDVQMQDERSEPVARDTEANSQDSGGSGATVGESLRSLEVEIGSADGHDEGDRQPGPERLGGSASGAERGAGNSRRPEQGGDTDEDMEGTGTAGLQGEDAEGPEGRAGAGSGEHEVASTAGNEGGQTPGPQAGRDTSMSSIDPTFLEALPADLRAEVLASQQTRAVRPPNPAPAPTEEIDPEFLAALPPDIQAEVLAQQQAQRAVIAHAIEGQPVDMDSASIIATFPAELREEVGVSTW